MPQSLCKRGRASPLTNLLLANNQLTGSLNLSACLNLFQIDASVSTLMWVDTLLISMNCANKYEQGWKQSEISSDDPPQHNSLSGILPSPEQSNNLQVVQLAYNNFSTLLAGEHVFELNLLQNG